MLKDYSIIGSGFSSLSAAASLAKQGGNVKVFEKNVRNYLSLNYRYYMYKQ